MMQTNTQLLPVSRWPPFSWRPLREYQEEMMLVRERFAARNHPALASSYPLLNIWGDSDKVYAEAELPGMQLDHLEIYVTDENQLTIQGERRKLELDKGAWCGQERGFGQFSRTIMLPVKVDADKVEARLEHGVLFVTLPKSEAAKPRRISVNDLVNSPAIKEEQRTELAVPEAPLGLCFTPRVDVVETEQESLLLADLPGVKPEDADVRFDNGELIIDGRCAPRCQGASCLLSEYGVGDFYRAFTISEQIDWQKISAELKNGVLTVHLPKTETAKPRKITVKGE
ncbi:MAG TPA: Hsp20 family protein [Gemmataceae bacterium]|nr:Hsp20 family protein [Gemmataceae bacterium]